MPGLRKIAIYLRVLENIRTSGIAPNPKSNAASKLDLYIYIKKNLITHLHGSFQWPTLIRKRLLNHASFVLGPYKVEARTLIKCSLQSSSSVAISRKWTWLYLTLLEVEG